MSKKYKAIQTKYKGYKFRSRLEARWAVFFDSMMIDWEYEPEGFDLGDSGYYLPDFYLPKKDEWIEVKSKELNQSEREKAFALSSQTDSVVICLNNIPDPDEEVIILSCYLGAESAAMSKFYEPDSLIEFYLENACGNVEDLSKSKTLLKDALAWDCEYYKSKYKKPHHRNFENGMILETHYYPDFDCSRSLIKARSARFEHGETP